MSSHVWTPCTLGCIGVIVSDGNDGLHVERCDDCARFVDDDEALEFLRDWLPIAGWVCVTAADVVDGFDEHTRDALHAAVATLRADECAS